MPVYSSPESFQQVLTEVLSRSQHSDAAHNLRKAQMSVCFVYTQPELVLLMDGKTPTDNGDPIRFQFGPVSSPPDVTFTQLGDVGHRFWSGSLNVPGALARGQIKASGSIAKALKLLPLMPPLFKTYCTVLQEQGMGDLIP
ncbi:hypothetical protein [Deinococcus cellulosilyticus]|uniref:SCP2 domain-containing protein n=1 Tax=Deinococcus cellulosilyticus (strain DSM 18568 / NBRC 106333 / KACC 11606 / 5516J-15) TaxID=1223518 RepID=A0A511N1L5_DEIC1|nr:hypothetical protein [Deinococcus cellulosilyticus]GEM46377.1 hypothetical protein DC3_20120 [Deinococcus cellulosilyticus NBRC 106333 = KACC 11606]